MCVIIIISLAFKINAMIVDEILGFGSSSSEVQE